MKKGKRKKKTLFIIARISGRPVLTSTVRKNLLATTELHTILRLPTGIFYKQGVKANVLFFENKPASKTPWTKEVWIYDFRTNIHFTLKEKTMKFEDLLDFIKCYNPENRHLRKETWSKDTPNGRWRKFPYEEIVETINGE